MSNNTLSADDLNTHGLVQLNCQYDAQIILDTVTVVLDLQYFDCATQNRAPRLDNLVEIIYTVDDETAVVDTVPRFSNWRYIPEMLDVSEQAVQQICPVERVEPWRSVFKKDG